MIVVFSVALFSNMHRSFISTDSILLSLFTTLSASPVVVEEDCSCMSASAGNVKDGFLQQILNKSSEYGTWQESPSTGPLKIGIIGAGATGPSFCYDPPELGH